MKRVLLLLILLLEPVIASAVNVPIVQTQVAVATTSTAVTTFAPVGILILSNVSDTTIYCNVSGGAATTAHLPIGVAMTAWFDIAVPATAVNCIHAGTGTKNLNVAIGR